MIKRIFLGLGLTVSMASALLAADSGTVQTGYSGSPYGAYQTGQGGEFTLLVMSGTGVNLSAYSSKTKDVGVTGTFQTFCIEENQFIYPNPSISDYIIGTGAINGGANVNTVSSPAGTYGNPDVISKGTAWLYSQFARGLLSNYDYLGSATSRKADADLIQKTFWFLENEIASIDTNNKFYLAVQTEFTDDVNLNKARANNDAGGYGVGVMNLWEQTNPQYTNGRQDQLVLVPDGGLTIALLGFALGGLGLVSRKLKV